MSKCAEIWEGMATTNGFVKEKEAIDTEWHSGSVVEQGLCGRANGLEVSEVEVFGEKDVYFCGEVGSWKDSGRDSQIVNARELRRKECSEERKNKQKIEWEYCNKEEIGHVVESPEVPKEYDRQHGNIMAVGVDAAEIEAFGHILGFPTEQRPPSYRRPTISSAFEIPTWFAASSIELGASLTQKQKMKAKELLYAWKYLFASGAKDMLVTDLLVHRISVYPGARLCRARDKLYTKEEREWREENIPKLEEAGIIARSESPWAHRTKLLRKKDRGLRILHVFCPINSVTMLSGYPTKRIEPVVNNLMQARFSGYFQADVANGFWAVRMHSSHTCRTAFSTNEGQWHNLRMGQGLVGKPQTYARLKGFFCGSIPVPNPEPGLNQCTNGTFESFVDDYFGAFTSFAEEFDFLHNYNFPRLPGARITLKGNKCGFFLNKMSPLGYASDGSGLRPSLDKVRAIGD